MGRRKISGTSQVSDPRVNTRTKTSRAVRKSPTQLKIAPGQPDTQKINALVREWLVPMLVKKFLSERPPTGTAVAQNPTFEALGKEDVA